MKCPVCDQEMLVAGKYESVSVKCCNGCEGHLVRTGRINAIKNSKAEVSTEIYEELLVPNERDTLKQLLCPGCLRSMEETKKRILDHEFVINECKRCRFTWFDGGELKKLQVYFEFSDQGEEMLRFRDRIKNLTAEERAEIDERIAGLKDPEFWDEKDVQLLCWIWHR